jgi:outer membrane protein TolC
MVLLAASPLYAGDKKLSLEQAIARALEHSYTVKAAAHDSAGADRQLKAARADRFPTLSLDAVSYAVDELQSFEIPIPGIPPIEIGAKETYQADFKLTVPLFTGGKIAGNIGRFRAVTDAARAGLETRRLETGYQTRRAYLNLMLADISIRSVQASRKRLEIIRTDIKNLHDNGLADSTDILETELAFQKVLLQADYQATVRTNAAATLNKLLGADDTDNLILTEAIKDPPPDADADISTDNINRPELAALRANIAAAENVSRLATADYFPNLSAYGGYSVGKPNKDMFNNTWNDYFSVGLALNWSFNLGGKKVHNKLSADRTAQSLEMTLNETEDSFALLARTARENVQYALAAYRISAGEFDIAERQFALAQKQQKAGKLSVNRLLEKEEELRVAQQAFEASKINYYAARTEYYFAVGSDKIYGGLNDE